jgi:DNA repair exonuclease SbcCD ATPase subunit
MEDDSLIVEESTRKPQSLRSLANYKKKAVDPSPDLAAVYPPTTLPLSPEFMETELGNSKATFIGVDSDLSQIFGSVVVHEIAEEEEVPLECDPTSFQGMRKFHQWNENSEMQNEIIHLQTVIEQLKIENQRLETAAAVAESSGSSVAAAVASKEEVIHHLRSEITTLQDQISNLQFDIKERDDQVSDFPHLCSCLTFPLLHLLLAIDQAS